MIAYEKAELISVHLAMQTQAAGSKQGAPLSFAWEVLSSFFPAHCGLICLKTLLLLLYIIKKPKKAIILQKRRQEKPLGTQGLSANHYLRLAQG